MYLIGLFVYVECYLWSWTVRINDGGDDVYERAVDGNAVRATPVGLSWPISYSSFLLGL